MHLFSQRYEKDKKLVLFWDEFDNAYKPERREEVAGTLRSVNNEVKKKTLCLGAYNANLVPAAGLSPFVPDKILSYQTLDFSLQETQILFRQFQEEWKVQVAPEVIHDIHENTGGHTGLVNFCGAYIEKQGGNFDLARWRAYRLSLLEELRDHKVCQNMMASLEKMNDPKVMDKLRQLCYSTEGVPISDDDDDDDDEKEEQKDNNTTTTTTTIPKSLTFRHAGDHLQHLGFAVVKSYVDSSLSSAAIEEIPKTTTPNNNNNNNNNNNHNKNNTAKESGDQVRVN